MTEMQFRGSVLIKPPKGENKGSTSAMLCKVHECLSPHVVADLERLRKRSRGKLMVGTNRYYFYVPNLSIILQERALFRVTLEMAGAWLRRRCQCQCSDYRRAAIPMKIRALSDLPYWHRTVL